MEVRLEGVGYSSQVLNLELRTLNPELGLASPEGLALSPIIDYMNGPRIWAPCLCWVKSMGPYWYMIYTGYLRIPNSGPVALTLDPKKKQIRPNKGVPPE